MTDTSSPAEKQDPTEIITISLRNASGRTHAAAAKAVVEALRAAGYAIKPMFATPEMIDAGRKAMFGRLGAGEAEGIWRAMVEAAEG